MKNLINYETVPVEIAIDLLVSNLQWYIYKDQKAKDKKRLEIALAEIKVLENSIIKSVK